ncbi:MAG: hypothetical protein ABIV51_00600 [Saprospiraceae bacterium]
MKSLLYLICLQIAFLLIDPTHLSGQQFIQIEKKYSMKTRRILPGEIVSYQLKTDKGHWYREELVILYPEEGKIRFANRLVDLDQIQAIRLGSSHKFWNVLGEGLKIFAYQWAFFSVAVTVIGTPLSWSSLFVPVIAFTTGVLIKYLNNGKTFHFKEKYRLRLLDLDFAKP